MADEGERTLEWHRVLGADELGEGRVTTVVAADRPLALTHYQGQYSALDNRCPHQGGPLGQGSIEQGWLRCPWHGYDYDPQSGDTPPGFDDCVEMFPVEERSDGIYVGVPPKTPHGTAVADILMETVANRGVRHVFGMVGHSNLGLADAMRRLEAEGRITFIGIRHEGAAAFAASAYAKLTGRPAACFSIARPGATNLMTGLWDAKVDRAPLLAITGQVDTQVMGPGAFQELDLAAAFAPVARFSQTVLPGSRHAELANLAMKHAILERDVAHLIVPNEVQELLAPEGATPGGPEGRVPELAVAPAEQSVARAIARIRRAKRPLIVLGHGARFHTAGIIALAERLRAPMVTTFKAKGIVADDHPLAGGVLGHSGTPIASWLMNEADLLIVFGASFSHHTGIAEYKPTIQVDFDPIALGKFHPVEVPVLGEISRSCELLVDGLGEVQAEDQTSDVAQRWAIWREEKARRIEDDRGRGVNSSSVFAALNRLMPRDAAIAVDVGDNTYSFGCYVESSGEQSVVMSGYLGSIGFAFPAALGCWAAAPERPTVAIAGDGGFGQYMAELTTAVKYGAPIKLVLINNNELGKISREQSADMLPVWQTSLHNPNFAQYAELCGAFGVRVTERGELDGAIEQAFAHDGPALVEVLTDAALT